MDLDHTKKYIILTFALLEVEILNSWYLFFFGAHSLDRIFTYSSLT